MSDGQKRELSVPPPLGDERDTIISRAIAGGIRWSIEQESGILTIEIPNGQRATRKVPISAAGANIYSTIDFASITALGPYEAVWQRTTGVIEAAIEGERGVSFLRLAQLPDTRAIRSQDTIFEYEDDDEGNFADTGQQASSAPREWVLNVRSDNSPISMEISPPSPAISALGGRSTIRGSTRPGRPTLKITGVNPADHDSALSILENMSSAFFFELDLKRNVILKLSKARSRQQFISRFRKSPAPLTVPRKKYSNEAISLYTYGRHALGMPLLQFLAFYQCIEYYFPQYWNSEMIARVRRLINDPVFDSDEDGHVGRLIGVASVRGRGASSEREQLRITVESCVDVVELNGFLEENESVRQALLAKNRISGVAQLMPQDKNNSLVNQVANRIYDIRCRIVHTKEDGGPSGNAEVLLPFSVEADLLDPDVMLVRHVAQKVIIAGRRGNQW